MADVARRVSVYGVEDPSGIAEVEPLPDGSAEVISVTNSDWLEDPVLPTLLSMEAT
jgi:hypothetical protein